MKPYREFLASKQWTPPDSGIACAAEDVAPALFDFQRHIVAWAVGRGRAAVWADTGLGKTRMQLEWARLTLDHAGGRALILAPLGVAAQTVAEAASIGIEVAYVHDQAEAEASGARIVITNYERLHKVDPAAYTAVVLDESSILKSYSGVIKRALVASFRATPYRLACTATPAPNDLEELCNHADFLGVMKPAEMRSTFFIADSRGEFMRYRLKGHARDAFYTWLASWAIACRNPADLGFDGSAYELPPLEIVDHLVPTGWVAEGELFHTQLKGVTQRAQVRRETLTARVDRVLEIVNGGRGAPRVQPAVAGGEPRARAGVPAADQGAPERAPAGAVRAGSGTQEEGGGSGPGEPEAGSAGAARIPVSDRPGTPRTADGPRLRDLQGQPACRPGGEAARGPRPRDGEVPRRAVPAVQPGPGASRGRSDSGDGDVQLPDACGDQWLIWCGTNAEQDLIVAQLGDECVSIDGRTPYDEKLRLEACWRAGEVRVMVTKATVYGWGVNWQHCHQMVFCGISDSYEQYYQAIRRCYRFGQIRPVRAHIVLADVEHVIAANVRAKEAQARAISAGLIAAVTAENRRELFAGTSKGDNFEPRRPLTLPDWLEIAS